MKPERFNSIFFLVLLFISSSAMGAIQSKKFEIKNPSEQVSERWKSSQQWLQKQSAVNLQWSQNVIQNGDWIVKSALVAKICKIKSAEAQEVLSQLLNDKALVVRSVTVDCLAQRMNPAVREALWSAVQDPINKRGEQSLWIREQILEVFLAQPSVSDRLMVSRLKESEKEAKILSLVHQMSLQFSTSLRR